MSISGKEEEMWTPGLPELLVILFIILLVFGAKRLPELMKSMGKGVSEFKKGMREEEGKGKEEGRPEDEKKDSGS